MYLYVCIFILYIYIYIYIYFETKDWISLQIFKTLVTLTWDSFTVPLLSEGEMGLIINAIRLNKLLWLIFISVFSNTSCSVGGHWCFWPDSLEFLHLQLLHSFLWTSVLVHHPLVKQFDKTESFWWHNTSWKKNELVLKILVFVWIFLSVYFSSQYFKIWLIFFRLL